jgi:hypothetical protein
MKYLKLFEKFTIEELIENNKKANEILEDIKSISYIIEDEGFDIQYTFQFSKDWKQSFINVDDYNTSRDAGRARKKINGISLVIHKNSIETSKKTRLDFSPSDNEILNNFIVLLKEHLDYIDGKSILSGRGNFNNSMSILIQFG